MSRIRFADTTAPITPPTGFGYLYYEGDEIKLKRDDGTVAILSTVGGGGTTLPSVITVDPAGTVVAGESYTNLEDAVLFCEANASSAANFIILITKNIALTSAITITNEFYTITGLGQFASSIKVDDSLAGSPIITIDLGNISPIPSFNPISNIRIIGTPTLEGTAGTQAIDVRGNGVHYIQNLRLDNFHTGINCDNDALGAQFVVLTGETIFRDCTIGLLSDNTDCEITNCVLTECETAIQLEGATIFTVRSGLITGAPTEVNLNTGIINNSTGTALLKSLEFKDLAIGIVLNSTGKTSFDKCDFSPNNTFHAQITAAAEIETVSTQIDLSKVAFVVPPASILGDFVNLQQGDRAFTIYEELNVGSPQQGFESIFGQGDSYTVSALYYEFNGTSFVDVKPNLINKGDGLFWSFPNVNAGTALYLSNQFGLTFPNIKASLTASANLGTGDIVYEYWNGSTWTEFNHMIAESDDTYLPFANDKFEVPPRDYQVRFDDDIQPNWVQNDPVGLGFNSYWIRLRISNTIIASPTFDQIKIGTNRTEINDDGYKELQGTAREVEKFPINFGNFAAAGNSPSNGDIYLSDTLFAGRNENNFVDGATDRTGLAQMLPYDIDTSTSIQTHITYIVDSNTAGNVDLSLKWSTLRDGEQAFDSTGSAPSTAPREREIVRSIAIPSGQNEISRTEFFKLEIPEAIAQKRSGGSIAQGDIFFLTITRTGGSDSFGGDFRIIDLALYYPAWREGGHLKAER